MGLWIKFPAAKGRRPAFYVIGNTLSAPSDKTVISQRYNQGILNKMEKLPQAT
jgi:hypothetical protein